MNVHTHEVRTGPDALVTGSSGIVGRRVVAQLRSRGLAFRATSRSGTPPFGWTDSDTWSAHLAGVRRLILIPAEGVPVPPDFLPAAAAAGVERVALLSDKGAEAMRVDRLLAAEQMVRDSGLSWSIIRPDWFNQNFDESFFRPGILAGLITVPIGEVRQGFVDAEDIAAVLVAMLVDDRHVGQTYVVTGPTSVSFTEAVNLIGCASGREVRFAGDADSYRRGQEALGADPGQTQREIENFARLAALGDASPTRDVERVAGRPALSFPTFVRRAAARGAWH